MQKQRSLSVGDRGRHLMASETLPIRTTPTVRRCRYARCCGRKRRRSRGAGGGDADSSCSRSLPSPFSRRSRSRSAATTRRCGTRSAPPPQPRVEVTTSPFRRRHRPLSRSPRSSYALATMTHDRSARRSTPSRRRASCKGRCTFRLQRVTRYRQEPRCGTDYAGLGSFGSPNTRSPTMLRMISSVPPATRMPGTPSRNSCQA